MPPPQPDDGPGVQVELYGLEAQRARVSTARVLDELGWYALCPTTECKQKLTRAAEESVLPPAVPKTSQQGIGPEGDIIPPAQVAERIVEFLGETRTLATPVVNQREAHGQAVVTQPVGAAMTANIELVGLRGQPVLLSWSIHRLSDGDRLFGRWLSDMPVYRLEPTSEHDTTSVDLWIPLPKSPGPYFVRLMLALDDSPLASADSEPFD